MRNQLVGLTQRWHIDVHYFFSLPRSACGDVIDFQPFGSTVPPRTKEGQGEAEGTFTKQL